MKVVKTLGLVLFLVGFGIFNATFFTADYQLTESILKDQLGENDKVQLFNENSDLTNKTITSNFQFVSSLDETFRKVNEIQLSKYAISDEEIDALIAANTDNFSLQTLSILGDSDLAEYKRKTFNDYGNWLDGRSFNSKEEMKALVSQVVDNIKKYQIVNEKGFDQYKVKDLKYALTKASAVGPVASDPALFLVLTYVLCIVGAFLYIIPKINDGPPGIKNNGIFHSAMKNTGWLGILTGAFLIAFYIVLYFYPEYMTNWIIMVDPLSQFLKGSDAGRFFLYGFIYTLCILVMGVRMLIKYRHSKYQMVRTFSVMFFQTAFAFLIPEILLRLNQPYFDFKNIWPLDYDFFFDNELDTLLASGGLGLFMLGWGIALIIIGVPVFVYFFGKRWYCSWVCGCGGLAETLGDPYRQLSDKSLGAWKVERWMIHSVLVFAVVMTGGVLYTYWTGNSQVFGFSTYDVRSVYGAWIGAGFAGVVGTGFYPLMGNRVWCRFGCPLAAYLGIIQRFKSRFRITTNGGQCIS
ncbi:MAG: 4Fe-4S binding protein, partial [Fulvivirga sp.]|uniref:4Fe-4S binding protein n=1 Tax=Fulvivirga sp. TaxID=1931237 RepID=UPI0032EFF972